MNAVTMVASLSVLASSLAAQMPADSAVRAAIARFAVGAPIQVHQIKFQRISGTLMSTDSGQVVIAPGGAMGSRAAVPVGAIDTVWALVPTPHRAVGGAVGGVLGLLAGVVLALSVNGIDDRPGNSSGAIVFGTATVGVLLGVVAGSNARSWRPAYP